MKLFILSNSKMLLFRFFHKEMIPSYKNCNRYHNILKIADKNISSRLLIF